MAITVEERYDSPSITEGADPAAELSFLIHGTADEALALQELQMQAPGSYSGLPRRNVTVAPMAPLAWLGRASYALKDTLPPQPTGGSTFAFDTTGGQQHITHALSSISRHAAPGDIAPDFQGAIGVTDSSVEGVDITVPVYRWSETHYLPDSQVTEAYKGVLFGLTGTVNDDVFKGFAAGECLFLGASGSKRSSDDWEIAFRFAGSPNVSGLTIGEIVGISKKGWEYLWVRYESDVDDTANRLIQKPSSVHVEQVYRSGNFTLLGIGGGGGGGLGGGL
jgi:hypothetical protein